MNCTLCNNPIKSSSLTLRFVVMRKVEGNDTYPIERTVDICQGCCSLEVDEQNHREVVFLHTIE